MSKVIEKTVNEQIGLYCDTNCLNEPLQSAYRKCHCTESALLKVQNDIQLPIDKKEVVLLTMLDLSAAFDTVTHEILLARLSFHFGIMDTALGWFTSFLKDRSQQLQINSVLSDPKNLETGFPQGSGTGPSLYNKYARRLGDLIRVLLILFHADVCQMYECLIPGSISDKYVAREKLENAIAEVSAWMKQSRLKLNETKPSLSYLDPKLGSRK